MTASWSAEKLLCMFTAVLTRIPVDPGAVRTIWADLFPNDAVPATSTFVECIELLKKTACEVGQDNSRTPSFPPLKNFTKRKNFEIVDEDDEEHRGSERSKSVKAFLSESCQDVTESEVVKSLHGGDDSPMPYYRAESGDQTSQRTEGRALVKLGIFGTDEGQSAEAEAYETQPERLFLDEAMTILTEDDAYHIAVTRTSQSCTSEASDTIVVSTGSFTERYVAEYRAQQSRLSTLRNGASRSRESILQSAEPTAPMLYRTINEGKCECESKGKGRAPA
ncbi:hypothetical protein LTR36_005675 [Oleoguttula mirabilis]|uniref:Uncharacterized protein n=1 Tax=Oleoguttula mirabilis TaxID=1507867 RepID=A0AAV9JE81_9PEZI|nr:hypothetical protein LTR36_005675 [Oleoguttula mirabilis]